MNKPQQPKREVRYGDSWMKVTVSKVVKTNWLEYELRDGTVGLAQPKNWREVPTKAQ